MKISILIPTLANKKSLPYLQRCVDSIRRNSTSFHDVRVMVNGGNFIDPEVQANIFYITPQGQCQAVNALAKNVENEYIMVVNDDMLFPPNWEDMLQNANKNTVVSANTLESGKGEAVPPFNVNQWDKNLETFDIKKYEKEAIKISKKETKDKKGKSKSPLEKGFNLPFVIHKELWDKIGGYDESFDPWGSNSDSDLAYKIKLAGDKSIRDRRIVFYHFSLISGTFDEDNKSYWQQNITKFERKWGFARARYPKIWYDFPMPKDRNFNPSWAKL